MHCIRSTGPQPLDIDTVIFQEGAYNCVMSMVSDKSTKAGSSPALSTWIRVLMITASSFPPKVSPTLQKRKDGPRLGSLVVWPFGQRCWEWSNGTSKVPAFSATAPCFRSAVWPPQFPQVGGCRFLFSPGIASWQVPSACTISISNTLGS